MDKHKKYRCKKCDHIYDPVLGDPESGIPAGTTWRDVPEDWCCPVCQATKADFEGFYDEY